MKPVHLKRGGPGVFMTPDERFAIVKGKDVWSLLDNSKDGKERNVGLHRTLKEARRQIRCLLDIDHRAQAARIKAVLGVPQSFVPKYSNEDLVARLAEHIGHTIEIVGYGKNKKEPWFDISLECLDCGEVIIDFDVFRHQGKYLPTKE